jgi:hypothetical protein
MREKMFSGKAELLHEKVAPDVRISEAALTLRKGRTEDRKREEELIEWIRKIRT